MPRKPEERLAAGRLVLRFPRGFFLIGIVLLGVFWAPLCRASLVDYLQLPQIFPEHDLVVLEGARPDWKKEWDNGRRLVRSGEYREAAECYRRLLSARGNIAQARWEFSLVLARLEEWDKARTELELLAEASPDNIEYLNVLGLALRHTGQIGRALEIFSKVRERSPENFIALVGEALGLFELGRKREALPLFQAVASKYPDDRDLALSLISMASDLGQLEIARKYLLPLATARKVDLDILIQAARVHDALGREKEGIGFWEKSLGQDPFNREARERLARYYEDLGQPDRVLGHLQALWENDPKNTALLSRICRIYIKLALFTDGRVFYEKYLQLHPEDLDLIRSIVNLKTATDDELDGFYRWLLVNTPDGFRNLHSLATELVATDKVPEAVVMWERLARVSPERVEAYRALDPLLTKLGHEKRLLEVLQAINRVVPGDQDVLRRLARLKVTGGDLGAGLDYYNQLEQSGYRSVDLYADRSAIYEVFKQPSLALADYEKLLALVPERLDIRRRAIELAGELGEVKILTRLAVGLDNVVALEERAKLIQLLADSFRQAWDFEQAAKYYQLLMTFLDHEGVAGLDAQSREPLAGLRIQARLGVADLYRREGLLFEEEQLLRAGLLEDGGQIEILARLFEVALSAVPPDLESAAVWLEQYGRQPLINQGLSTILQARLRAAAAEYPQAKSLLLGLLAERMDAGEQNSIVKAKVYRLAGLSLAEVLFAAGEHSAAEHQCLSMLTGRSDREVLVLLAKIYADVGESKAADNIQRQLVDSHDGCLELLELGELFKQRGLQQGLSAVAEKIWTGWPASYRAELLRIQALLREGKITEALAVNEVLGERFPENLALKINKARINFQGGYYRQAVKLCEVILDSQPARLDIHLLRVKSEMALANVAEATRLVGELYPVTGAARLKKLFTDSGLPLPVSRLKRSLWQILTFQDEPLFDLVGEVLSPRVFFDATPDRRRINELVTAEFAGLLWERLFLTILAGGDFSPDKGKLAKTK